MTTRDIADALQEMYGAEVSHSLIAKVTDAVQDDVQKWQSRPLENLYPILYLDGIESANSVIRKAINKRKVFPTDDAAKKVIYLAIRDASKKWTMPIRNWKAALNRFLILFEDRLADHI